VIVVDTSAVLAILQLEPEAPTFAHAVESASERLISAVSVLEAGIVSLARRGQPGVQALETFIAAAEFDVVAFDAEQALIARGAFGRYGKGRHPAGLNFGDCASYALAASRGLPLLFKGADFAKTDIAPAIACTE
jgi:ribonuclease VapC